MVSARLLHAYDMEGFFEKLGVRSHNDAFYQMPKEFANLFSVEQEVTFVYDSVLACKAARRH